MQYTLPSSIHHSTLIFNSLHCFFFINPTKYKMPYNNIEPLLNKRENIKIGINNNTFINLQNNMESISNSDYIYLYYNPYSTMALDKLHDRPSY